MKDLREKLEEEKKVFADFGNVLVEARRNNKFSPYEKNSEHYMPELKIIRSITGNCLLAGLVSGAVSFIVLRRLRVGLSRWFSRRGYDSNDVTPHLDPHQFAEHRINVGANPFRNLEQQQTNNKNPGLRMLLFLVDFSASCAVATFTTFSLFDLDKAISTLTTLPLVEGRSRFAELICEGFVQEMQKRPPEFWENVQHPRMKSFAQLGLNCQRRRSYEEYLLKQLGNEWEPLVVPSPGVPPDYPINNQDNNPEETTFDPYVSDEGQNDMVKDWVSDNEFDPYSR